MVYCIRVLAVEKLLPAACRNEQTDEDQELFLYVREKYLADGSYSLMSEAISLLAYGKRETGKRLRVELHTLDYQHTAVSISRVVVGESFSKGYQDKIRETEEAEHRFLGLEGGEGEQKEAWTSSSEQVLSQEEVGFQLVEQEQALHAVLDGQTPLVVVLLTGGGKSLLFSVPACLEGAGITVVVVPY
ncbi:hypothetical protein CC80DRAFT_555452 [Byssothecium circinans]|uniref:DEAD/DEAH box helicase domain-containing protein n=1 Tax=Byssothecium circinans TaxID=147558 RepID=A0A6A5TEP6_9PLEO|nr:hypothetical protein CC80DRAFT_555452 [Byssothecium circinans]